MTNSKYRRGDMVFSPEVDEKNPKPHWVIEVQGDGVYWIVDGSGMTSTVEEIQLTEYPMHILNKTLEWGGKIFHPWAVTGFMCEEGFDLDGAVRAKRVRVVEGARWHSEVEWRGEKFLIQWKSDPSKIDLNERVWEAEWPEVGFIERLGND